MGGEWWVAVGGWSVRERGGGGGHFNCFLRQEVSPDVSCFHVETLTDLQFTSSLSEGLACALDMMKPGLLLVLLHPCVRACACACPRIKPIRSSPRVCVCMSWRSVRQNVLAPNPAAMSQQRSSLQMIPLNLGNPRRCQRHANRVSLGAG